MAFATCVAVARKNEELHVPGLRMRVCACLITCCKKQAEALNNLCEYQNEQFVVFRPDVS